jgi:hypothetical protein
MVAANILSVAGVALSMTAIFAFLVNQGFSRFEAVACCLALAATEPFVTMANQSKYEYVTFLLAVWPASGGAPVPSPCQSDFSVGNRGAADRHYGADLPRRLRVEHNDTGRPIPRRIFDRVAKLVLGGVLDLVVFLSCMRTF